MQNNIQHKSGQAIIFLMVVIVIGLFVVIWNFDLHRVINAKVKVRNATDAAAMAAARWQGVTLNMIGDLNLIQAAILSQEALAQEYQPVFIVPASVAELHDLRNRLCFLGPLASFAIAQQAAFDNGALRDPALESVLYWMAEEIRNQPDAPPFDNMDYDDYGDLLASIADHGAAVSSYTADFPGHPLTDQKFYAGIAQALGASWCGLDSYQYWLEHYDGVDSWSDLDLDELVIFYMLELKLREFVSMQQYADTGPIPSIALTSGTNDFSQELESYVTVDDRSVFASKGGFPAYVVKGMYPYRPDADITWHVFGNSWARTWPKPLAGEDDLEEEDGEDPYRFPIRSAVKPRYNYMGAEAGFQMAAPVHRGILSTPSSDTVNLSYRAKAKPFGYMETESSGDMPPYFLGYVFPVFTDVRLIHSDIGDDILPPDFFIHVVSHLEAYLEGGVEALNPDCRYCRLLRAWEKLDREEGLRWLEEAEESDNNPCDPDDDDETSEWQGLRGGASGGS